MGPASRRSSARQHQLERDEADIDGREVGRFRQAAPDRACECRSSSSEHAAGYRAQLAHEAARARHRADSAAAPRVTSTSVNPPVEAATSRQTRPSDRSRNDRARRQASRRRVKRTGAAGVASKAASGAICPTALRTGLPSARHQIRAIAACAPARLSNRPRSTSSTSARLRVVIK